MPTAVSVYTFGPFVLNVADRQLTCDGAEAVLRPKAFDTLLHLVRHHGHVVSRADLLDAVWPETNVGEAVLTHCIAEVRAALSDDARRPRYVKTVSRHGYRFIAAVEQQASSPTSLAPSEAPSPPAAFAIAVLPFANLGGDPESECLCDGLAEELISGLTKVDGLQVVAHSSSFSFKGRDLDVREIGRQLGVGTIIEGSVRRTGNRLRVSAQLIDAVGGCHRWCEQYDRRLDDVFLIQDEIGHAVLDAIRPQLPSGFTKAPPLFRHGTANLDAYVLYLQGRRFWHQRFDGGLQHAMECFGQAIAKDPGFAPAYTGLADSLLSVGVYGMQRPEDVFPKAAVLAETALRLDDQLAEAHASRAAVRMFWDWEWPAAERGLLRALELNTGNALNRLWYGHYLSIVGRMEEAIAEVLRARSLDPLSPVCSANVGWTFYLAHQPQRAIDELRLVLARAPGNAIALFYLGYACVELGRYDEAIEALGHALRVVPGMPFCASGIAMACGFAGRRAEAVAILAETRARARGFVADSERMLIHLGLGEDEAVLECLDRAVDARDVLLPWVRFMPPLDRFHGHPRFEAALRRVGL